MALPDDPDESDSSLVWIDAVCINQQDLNERSSQVAFMTDIYELASSVVVWLGRHDNHSRRAMPLIASFAQVDEKRVMHNPEANQYQTSLLTDAEFYEQNHIKPLSLADWNDIRSFYSRSWFHRLWTTQELVVNKSVIIECGESNLARDDVENFLAIISKRGWMRMNHEKHFAETSRYGSIFGGDIMLGIGYVRREDFTSDPREDSISDLLLHLFEYRDYDSFTCAKLAWILQMARYRETTDQRDKIFGTQGLASRYRMPGDWHLMRPDYTKTVEGVFTQAARYILQKLRNLSFVSCVEDKSYRAYPDLPSWVPDFSTLARPPQLLVRRSYNASCGIEGSSTLICRKPRYSLTSTYSTVLLADRDAPSFTFKADGIALSVFGVRIDVLDALSGDCENAVQQNKVSTLLVVAAQAQMIYHNGETRGELFMRTLAAKDSNSSDCWRGMDPPFGFEDLQLPFSQFLKMNLALEIWRRNSSHFQGSISWWDERKDLEEFCD